MIVGECVEGWPWPLIIAWLLVCAGWFLVGLLWGHYGRRTTP